VSGDSSTDTGTETGSDTSTDTATGITSETSVETTAETTVTTPETTTTATVTTAPPVTTTVPTVSSITDTTPAVTTTATTAPADEYLFTIAGYGVTEDYAIFGGIAIMLIVAFLLNYRSKKKKKALESDNTPKTARERDAQRISELKKSREKKKTKKKKIKAAGQPGFFNPKRAIDRLPYKKILEDDIWLIDEDTYSRAYIFDDINYNMYDGDQKQATIIAYCAFLNSLDDTIDCQISLFNKPMSVSDLEREILIKSGYEDGFSYLREEYNNRVLRPAITKGIEHATSTYQKVMCLTLTIKTSTEDKARLRFNTIDISVVNQFGNIGNTKIRVMKTEERIELLHDVFYPPAESQPTFKESDYRECAEKLYISPDYFEWKNGYFIFDDTYAAVLFEKFTGREVVEDVLTKLLQINLDGGGKMLLTMNLIAHEKVKAQKIIQHQITAIQTNVSQRNAKAAQRGVIQETPKTFQDMIDDLTMLHDKVSGEGQNLFSTNFLIMVTANDYDALLQNIEYVKDSLKGTLGDVKKIPKQQYDAFCDVLPCGSHRAFTFRRNLNSAVIAVAQPFNVTEIRNRDGVYYGRNTLSGNIITFNKFTLINPSGFILGCPGSGKSFAVKREMIDAFLRYRNADIMIIDPEREYGPLVAELGGTSVKISPGSTNYINPFEFDIDLLDAVIDDEKVNVVADKSNLITGFISAMDMQTPLSSQEKSFIDRCVRKSYDPLLKKLADSDYHNLPSDEVDEIVSELMPTLGTFYDIMKNEEENVNAAIKEKLLATLEMYVTGSANYFNNATNIDVNNRVISYDIKELSNVLKTQSMMLILDYIWNRLSHNRNNKRSTWIYIDEIYLLFADDYCLQFLKQLYKRARKYGGVLTGITQNVEDLLRNDDCRTMLSNSEFLMLLKQSSSDREKLEKTLNLSKEEAQKVDNVARGQGMLVLGLHDKIPFADDFPDDTKLYNLMNTNPQTKK
jgi:hypothetical protein